MGIELADCRSLAQLKVPRRVFKLGSSSGLTHGFLTSLADHKTPFHFVKPGDVWQEISAPGDSGAAWVLEGTKEVVGIHVLGESDPDPTKEVAGMVPIDVVIRVFAEGREFILSQKSETITVSRKVMVELQNYLNKIIH